MSIIRKNIRNVSNILFSTIVLTHSLLLLKKKLLKTKIISGASK